MKINNRRPQIPVVPGSSSKALRQSRFDSAQGQSQQPMNINVPSGRPPIQKNLNDKQNPTRRAEMAAGGIRINKQVSKTGVLPKKKAADVMYGDNSQPEARLHRQQSHARQKNPNSYG